MPFGSRRRWPDQAFRYRDDVRRFPASPLANQHAPDPCHTERRSISAKLLNDTSKMRAGL
jgi:hypothetical protein